MGARVALLCKEQAGKKLEANRKQTEERKEIGRRARAALRAGEHAVAIEAVLELLFGEEHVAMSQKTAIRQQLKRYAREAAALKRKRKPKQQRDVFTRIKTGELWLYRSRGRLTGLILDLGGDRFAIRYKDAFGWCSITEQNSLCAAKTLLRKMWCTPGSYPGSRSR